MLPDQTRYNIRRNLCQIRRLERLDEDKWARYLSFPLRVALSTMPSSSHDPVAPAALAYCGAGSAMGELINKEMKIKTKIKSKIFVMSFFRIICYVVETGHCPVFLRLLYRKRKLIVRCTRWVAKVTVNSK